MTQISDRYPLSDCTSDSTYILEPYSPPNSPPETLPNTDPLPNSTPLPESQTTSQSNSLKTKNTTEVHQTCWANIYALYLFHSMENEILEAFIEENPQAGVLSVKRLIKGIKTPTSTLKVKFKGTTLPMKFAASKNHTLVKYPNKIHIILNQFDPF